MHGTDTVSEQEAGKSEILRREQTKSAMSDQQRYAVSARIIGVVHRDASKIKMFMISVFWSDENEVIVYRSFQDFKKFHRQLKRRFPLENPFRRRDRAIPKFSARARKTNLQKKGLSKSICRMRFLENYCAELLRSDSIVTRSSEVIQFFTPKDHDLKSDFAKNSVMILPSDDRPGESVDMSRHRLSMGNVTHPFVTQTYRCIAPYETKDTKNRPFKVALDEKLEVLIKDPGGWWLVENAEKHLAWFPAPYLEMCEEEEDENDLGGIPLGGALYCAVRSYSTKKCDEVSVPIGAVVELLRKSDDGWWLIRYNGKAGYAPSMYLLPYNNPCTGLHTLQRKLHSSSLNLATGGTQSGNLYLPTLYEDSSLQQPRGEPYMAARLQKARSLDILSKTCPVPAGPTQRETHRKYPHLSDSRKSSLSGTSTESDSNLDFSFFSESSSGIESLAQSRPSSSSSSREEAQSPPGHPRSSTQLEESDSGHSSTDESLSSSSSNSQGSCKMATTAPRVPPRPRAQEILTRCTTMTRKAALASRARLVLQQEQIQSR